MLLSIFLAAWHVYPVLYVSLVQRCAYAYRTMEVQKLMPGGSCTYSTSSLKWCQGGPHLQGNLTTKVKRSTTSNQILATPAASARQFPSRGCWRGLRPPCLVSELVTWLICWPSNAPVQCHDCFGNVRSSQFTWERVLEVHTACLWPRCQQPCSKHYNYYLQSCCVYNKIHS